MKSFFVRWLLLAAITIVWAGASAHAARTASGEVNSSRKAALLKNRLNAFAFPEQTHGSGVSRPADNSRIPLGSMTSTAMSSSPGVTIGWTFHDLQQIGSMGRMVETGPYPDSADMTTVHFGWTYLPGPAFVSSSYMYNAYESRTHGYAGPIVLHDPVTEYSGYVNVDVTPDNRALVGGHCDQGGTVPYQVQIDFDIASACGCFDHLARVPDSTAAWGQPVGTEAMWPKFFFQFGTDTVLHVVAQINTNNMTFNQNIMYFRRVGWEAAPESEWDHPPYLVAETPVLSHDITGERLGDEVCLAWTANLPYPAGRSPSSDFGFMDNDVFFQQSFTQGATWVASANITSAPLYSAGYRAFCDLSILYDTAGNTHIVWNACPWPAMDIDGNFLGDFDPQKARLMHWSTDIPFIRTIADHTYDPSDICGTPRWAMTVAKPSLGECDGKLYALWTQFNDIHNGIDDDCAAWRYTENQYWGAANGELWVAVSDDGGLTWDAQRNLTNSYTPNCDPWEGEVCQSDYWASMSRWGRQVRTGEDWTGAVIVDPSGGSSPTDWYLDIMYVSDLDAGGAAWDADGSWQGEPTYANDLDGGEVVLGNEGSWTNTPIKWFRLSCVEPVHNPRFVCSWHSYGSPNYQKPNVVKEVPIDFENLGTVPLMFAIAVGYAPLDPGGWLSYEGFGGDIPAGLGGFETGYVILNSNDLPNGKYYGYLAVTGNDPEYLPDTIWVEMIVADTICPVERDVVNTNVISLSVANTGNMGYDGHETANMDFYPEDCDSTARIYLHDGSPFIGRGTGADAVFYNSLWGTGWLDEYGFRPQCGHTPNDEPCTGLGGAEVYESGTFSTQDSTIALEKIWVAPAEDVSFIIQYMRVWSFDGNYHDDVMIGEVIDWDIPWDYLAVDPNLDTSAVNYGHADEANNLLYMQGYEAYGANVDTGYPYNCQYNDERFGGHAFVESHLNGMEMDAGPYGGFCGENDELVYPAKEGFLFEPFYDLATESGLHGTDAVEDLHTAMVYEKELDFEPATVYENVSILVTIEEGSLADLQSALQAGKTWYEAHGGMTMFRDDDESGQIDRCEGCCKVMGDFQHDNDLDPLDVAAFVAWLWGGGVPPACMAECNTNCSVDGVNPLDAVHLVNYFWSGGPPPCNCWELP